MRTYFMIVISVGFFAFSAKAQTYGYLGMRNLVEFELGLSPVLSTEDSPDPDGNSSQGRFFLNQHYGLNFFRMVTPGMSMGILADYMPLRTWFDNNLGTKIPVKVGVKGLGLGFRFTPFARKSIEAPLGPVTEFDVQWIRGTINPMSDPGNPVLEWPQSLNLLVFRWKLGYNHIIKDRFVLQPGISFSLPNRLDGYTSAKFWVWQRMGKSRALLGHITFGVLI